MISLTRDTRDLTVERMLIKGGFNRETFMAVNTVIKARIEAHPRAEPQKTASATRHPAAAPR